MEETKRCSFCDEPIRLNAIKCRYCGSMLTDPPSPSGSLSGIDLVRQALGDRYEVLHELGRGGMATVYKAIQKNLNRPVALKVIHQNLVHDEEFVKRFHREAQVCASLQHPNIVTVYDEGEVSGVHFLAMEYLEGTDLHRLIRSRGRLTPKQTLQYILSVAEALDYAHGKGYIHRDIKSANIFITNSGRVILMDFGIAHAVVGTQLTRAGTVIGTPEYMSPEQAEGKKVDHKTDLYSLGVVMYECLAGRVPFKGDNAASVLQKIIHETTPAVPILHVPLKLKQTTLRLLCKNANSRISSAKVLINNIVRTDNDGISGVCQVNENPGQYESILNVTANSNDVNESTFSEDEKRMLVFIPVLWFLFFSIFALISYNYSDYYEFMILMVFPAIIILLVYISINRINQSYSKKLK